MAIRFQCGACAQPIEIDDEWGSKAVACPYCRKTVTAPAESTLVEIDEIPTAKPLATLPPTKHSGVSVPEPVLATRKASNPLAVVAAVLVGCMVLVLIAEGAVVSANELEFRELSDRMQKISSSDEGFAGVIRAQLEFYEERGGMPHWMVTVAILHALLGVSWLAALVCGVIAIRRPARRGLAGFALITCGIVPLFACCGGMG